MCIGSSSEQHLANSKSISKQSSSNSIVLIEDDIHSICVKLESASKDWFNLGLALGVKFYKLKNIQYQYSDNMHCLTEMVGKRLEVTDPEHPVTWPYICECLSSPTVERNDVANQIEGIKFLLRKYSIFNIQVDIRFQLKGYMYMWLSGSLKPCTCSVYPVYLDCNGDCMHALQWSRNS